MEELHRPAKDAPFGWLAFLLDALKRRIRGGANRFHSSPPRALRALW